VTTEIAAAIGTHTRLTIWYSGGARLIEPHAYGTSQAGKELLKAFQVSGHSNSARPTGWKTFRVDRITAILPTDEIFSPQPDWTPATDTTMFTTFATL